MTTHEHNILSAFATIDYLLGLIHQELKELDGPALPGTFSDSVAVRSALGYLSISRIQTDALSYALQSVAAKYRDNQG